MPFREKSAWISLFCLVVAFGTFSVGRKFVPGSNQEAGLFFVCVVAFVVLRIVLYIIARVTAPDDARVPLDERERFIGLKAASNANMALIVGVLFVPLSMHMGTSKPEM